MFKFGQFTKKTLPKNFAEQILNLEMEVELNEQVQIELLQDLISLYMAGVEYYESIKDRRHLFFQKKLNALMVKPSFINSTNKFEETPKQPDIKQNKRAKFEEESRRIELDLIYSQTENKEAQVKGIVENHTNQVKKIENIIQKEIATQSDTFQQRLEKRRQSKLTHSFSQPEIDLQSQKSGNSNKKKQKEPQQPNNCIPLKQVIQEEDEAALARKNSSILQKTIPENKLRTNSLIHKSKNVQIIIKRSNSNGASISKVTNKEELIKEKQKIAQLYNKFTQQK